jgi:hypothetical protein
MDTDLAVHIADLLEHEASAGPESCPAAALDDLCHDSPELLESLPEWRVAAQEIVQREAQRQ